MQFTIRNYRLYVTYPDKSLPYWEGDRVEISTLVGHVVGELVRFHSKYVVIVDDEGYRHVILTHRVRSFAHAEQWWSQNAIRTEYIPSHYVGGKSEL